MTSTMTSFDVQGIDLDVPYKTAFEFLADPAQWPRWTNAFASVSGNTAVMRTPKGEVEVTFECVASSRLGHIDTTIHFPDGTSLTAWTRLVGDDHRCCYSFILPVPPAALEALEGGLNEQSKILAEELRRAKRILESE